MDNTKLVWLHTAESKVPWRVSCHGLWQDIFGDTQSYLTYYEQYKWKNNRVLLLTDEQELCSMLHLIRILSGRREPYRSYIIL